MRTLDMADAPSALADLIRDNADETVVIRRQGKPIATLVPISEADAETAALCFDPTFIAIVERSRKRLREEGALTLEEAQRRLVVRAP